MKRYILALALAAVAASPDRASAFFRPWCVPPPCMPFGYRYYGYYGFPLFRPYVVPLYQVQPVPFAPQPYYLSIPPAMAPRVQAAPAPTRAPVVTVTPSQPPPMVNAESDPFVRPAVGGLATPSPAPAPMSLIPDPMVPKTPPLVIPPLPGSDAKPMLPPLSLPSAVPSPAPGGNDPLPMIPLPEPRKVNNPKEDLPPLVLPPETPGGPSGVIPPITARSSPLAAAVKVQIFTAGGTSAGTLRKIGFFNHTNRDLDLVIEGKAVKLPKKSYLHAELPAKFTWKQADGTAEVSTVPESAAGLDVLFKE